MGPVENMTVGYLLRSQTFQDLKLPAKELMNGLPGVLIRKSLLKPTGQVFGNTTCTALETLAPEHITCQFEVSIQPPPRQPA